MRPIKIMEHVSLDGVIQPEGNNDYANGGWTMPYRSPAGAALLVEAQGAPFDLLLGRTTYDQWSTFWPTVTGGPFADALNAATKYVVTHRDGLEWGPAQRISAEGIRELKSGDGPTLLCWGSSTVTQLLLEQRLVDDVVLVTYPVVLGRGKRWAAQGATFTLVASKVSPTGVLVNTYRVAGE